MGIKQVKKIIRRIKSEKSPPRISARLRNQTVVFNINEISHFKAYGDYASFEKNNQEYLINNSITHLAREYSAFGFVRVHRSAIINIHFLQAIKEEAQQKVAVLKDQTIIPISRRMLANLKIYLG